MTLTCVSNEVGGTLAGNARWLGVPLAALLREAGIRPASTQLVCRSVDGMTIGAPTRSALRRRRRDAGLRHERRAAAGRARLPGAHGDPRPVRLRVGLQVAGRHRGHHVRRLRRLLGASGAGRSRGRSRSESRIDTPGTAAALPAGRRPIAGVAWAQDRGIGRVEVQVDDGDWRDAQLSPADVADDLWRQWVLPDDFAPGGTRSPCARRRPTARCRPTARPIRTPTAPPAGTASRCHGELTAA